MKRLSRNDSIIWLTGKQCNIPCPLCNSDVAKQKVLSAKSLLNKTENLLLYKCPSCKAQFFFPMVLPDYKVECDAAKIQFYIELGAGIDLLLEPLLYIFGSRNFSSLLDVGCGFGFLVHFSETCLGIDAIGVEPSPSGVWGRKQLGIKVFHEYLENCSELKDRKFDTIYCSELIEHVPDPLGFIRLLQSYLAEDGVLVLTTPNGSFIDNNRSTTELLAILWPGFHLFLFSRRALRNVLKKAGFSYVKVNSKRERLIAYASMEEIKPGTNMDRGIYLKYLSEGMEGTSGEGALFLGYAYRLFKELVNRGDYGRAEGVMRHLEHGLRTTYGADVLIPERVLKNLAWIRRFEEIGDTVPYSLPCIFYYMGIFYLNKAGDFRQARMFFRAGFEIGLHFLELGPSYFIEVADLLWKMKLHEGVSLLYNGDKEGALEIFSFISNQVKEGQQYLLVDPPSDDVLIETLFYQSLDLIQKRGLLKLFSLIKRIRKTVPMLFRKSPSRGVHMLFKFIWRVRQYSR